MKRKAIAGAVTGAIASMLLGNVLYAAPAPATDSSSLGNSNGTLATAPLGGDSSKTATVQVMGTVMVTARKKRDDKLFRSSQSVKTMDQDQIRAAGAVGGVAAAYRRPTRVIYEDSPVVTRTVVYGAPYGRRYDDDDGG